MQSVSWQHLTEWGKTIIRQESCKLRISPPCSAVQSSFVAFVHPSAVAKGPASLDPQLTTVCPSASLILFFCVTARAWWRCRPHLSALGSSTDLSLDGLVLSLAMPHAFANAPGNKSWFCPKLALFHVCVMASMKRNSIMVHWVDLPKAPVIKDTRENSSYCSEEKLCV